MDPTERRSAGPPAHPRPTRARGVVVVEGGGAIGEFVRAFMSGSEFEVVHASTLESAIRELRATANALAVVDDDLPLVRGLDLLGRLRSERPDLESVLVTRDESVASLAVRLVIDRFQCLKKPLRIDDLRVCVVEGVDRLERRSRAAARAAAEGEASAHEALKRRIEALERSTRNTSYEPPPPAPPSDPEAVQVVEPTLRGDGLRVLVVDDDPLVRKAMARTFKRHHVVTAENGRAATEAIERSKPDVIISDLKMPEMDGVELAEKINERWPELANRIVFVTGTASQIERARKVAPRQPLLTKPVSPNQLEARIAEVLEHATRKR
jgi:DNA-binding NtrC family response regulator